jgi:hypothetical protein
MNPNKEELLGLSPTQKRELLARLLQEKADCSQGWYPLSHNQRPLWAAHRDSAPSALYNEAFAWCVGGMPPLTATEPWIRARVQTLVDRHAALRTIYGVRHGQPMERVLARGQDALAVHDATAWSADQLTTRLTEEAHRPFDLGRGPVFRIHLFQRPGNELILLTVIHHIAIDLSSMVILVEELRQLLAPADSADLPPVTAQYPDFIDWQSRLLAGTEGARLWRYWQSQLREPLPVLRLPGERARSAEPTYVGATSPLLLGEGLTRGLRELTRIERVTLFTTLLTAFQILLGRLSGQEGVCVGTRMACRSRPEFARVVGFLANTIVLRGDLSGTPTFREMLARTWQTVLDALTNQDYPFPLLVERLCPKTSRSPDGQGGNSLCPAVFVLQQPLQFQRRREAAQLVEAHLPSQSEHAGVLSFGDIQTRIVPVELRVARTDLELEMFEAGNTLTGWLRYNVDLFERESISRLLRSFVSLLEAVVDNPHQRLNDLPG